MIRERKQMSTSILSSQYIRTSRQLSMKLREAASVTKQLLGALAFLHDRGIRHRNIVANNVLLKPMLGKANIEGDNNHSIFRN